MKEEKNLLPRAIAGLILKELRVLLSGRIAQVIVHFHLLAVHGTGLFPNGRLMPIPTYYRRIPGIDLLTYQKAG
jgi:hypothetical protein